VTFSGFQSRYPSVFPRYPECGFEVRPGWVPLVDALCRDLAAELERCPVADFAVEQVKEKFGGLRFYVHSATKAMEEMISKAEAESFRVCERCGAAGKPRRGGWVRTLCEGCGGE
jgi:hypothetical protein